MDWSQPIHLEADIFLLRYMCYNVMIKTRFFIRITRYWLLLGVVCLICYPSQVTGQYGGTSIVRHMQGTSEVEARAGLSDLGVAVSANYRWHINHRWFLRTGTSYEFDIDQRFDNLTLSWDLLINRYLLAHRKFFLSVMLGPTMVFEKLEGVDWEGKFIHPIAGSTLGVSADNYLTRRVDFTIDGMMRMVPGSEIGKVRLYLLAGLKYTLRN